MRNFITRSSRAFAIVLLACSMAVLGGCSLVRLGYNHGEELLYWWLNSYVHFDADQKPVVKKQIAGLFAWHRKTQLKDYSQWMIATQTKLQREVTDAEVAAEYGQIKRFAMTVIEKSLPALADLALTLHPEQIADIEKKFASNNDDYRKDRLDVDTKHRQNFRYKKVMEHAEYWFGDFNEEQEKIIRAASDARLLNNELWMAERQLRQQQLIAMLKKIQAEKPSRDAIVPMMHDYVLSVFDRARSADHQAFFDASRESTMHMAAVIINTATPAQKNRAAKKLQGWIDNFSALAGK